jgi:hypothetical protein
MRVPFGTEQIRSGGDAGETKTLPLRGAPLAWSDAYSVEGVHADTVMVHQAPHPELLLPVEVPIGKYPLCLEMEGGKTMRARRRRYPISRSAWHHRTHLRGVRATRVDMGYVRKTYTRPWRWRVGGSRIQGLWKTRRRLF